jgi:hypothetical protein
MKRRLFNLAVGISLVALIAILSLWFIAGSGNLLLRRRSSDTVLQTARSYWVGVSGSRFTWASSRYTGVDFVQTPVVYRLQTGAAAPIPRPSFRWDDKEIIALGFEFRSGDGGAARSQFRVSYVPCWFIIALTSILPAIRFFVWKRTDTRQSRNLCLHCGYDLRESPERCPECGTNR